MFALTLFTVLHLAAELYYSIDRDRSGGSRYVKVTAAFIIGLLMAGIMSQVVFKKA
jgi:hypothetical protein